MYSPNQLLLLAIATLLYAPYSEVANISPSQRPVVKAKAAVNGIPADTTTPDRRTLDRRLPRDEADLFRDGPDVPITRELRCFGSTRVNIRGLEDVRVVQMADGMCLPDFYNGGPTNFTLSGP
jgi:hemoglobin/transferrin/lactoferrin receptor protein